MTEIGKYTYKGNRVWETKYPNLQRALSPSHKALLKAYRVQATQLAEAEEVIRFYADKKKYFYMHGCLSEITVDDGSRARDYLVQKEKKSEPSSSE